MKLVQCKRKHYYDADKFASCPHCALYDKTAEDTDERKTNDHVQDEMAASVETSEQGLAEAVARILEKRQQEVQSGKHIRDSLPVGMLVIIEGEGIGELQLLHEGDNEILIRDNSVRINVLYKDRHFYVYVKCDEKDICRINEREIIQKEELFGYERIYMGVKTFLFVRICGEEFNW